MTQYITTSYTLDLILGQKSWIIQTTQKMSIACWPELVLLLLFVWPKQSLQSKCAPAQGNGGAALVVPAAALAGVSSAPAPRAAGSACILHPDF